MYVSDNDDVGLLQDQLADQPWCLQGKRLSSPEYAQVDGAHLLNVSITMMVLPEENIPLHDNRAYGNKHIM